MAYGAILGQSFETSSVLDNYFTKDETLTSDTAALYGLGTDAVPDDVLAEARSLITAAQSTANNGAQIVTGSFAGSNKETVKINFSKKPYVVFIIGESEAEASGTTVAVYPAKGVASFGETSYDSTTNLIGFRGSGESVTWGSDNSVTFTNSSSNNHYGLHNNTIIYYYVAVVR